VIEFKMDGTVMHRRSDQSNHRSRDDLDPKSSAFGVQFGGRSDDSAPRKVGADAWFDRPGGARFMVRDQVVRHLAEFPAGSDDLSAL
jgi:hypothetical protein